ncbi:MAG: hypothetical protein MJ147_01240 [Clostridia bacterium]|nr:hypothetical protein [Clostridia bacterium]
MDIFKSTEGIILTFRYLCVVVQAVVSFLVYKGFKRFNHIGAAVASIALLLYTPFGVCALSYNSMGILFLVMTSVLLLTDKTGVKKTIELVLAGICFAGAVLCCPYLVVLYAVYTLAVFVFFFVKRKNKVKETENILYIKNWFIISCGIGILAALFLLFVLTRASLTSIIASFPQIFNDPEHQKLNIMKATFSYFYWIVFSGYKSLYIYVAIFISFVAVIFDRKREKREALYMLIFVVLTILLLISTMVKYNIINTLMFPVNVCAFGCLLLFWKDENIKKIFFINWISGIVYSVCIHFSSNQIYYVISSASSVALVGSVVIIFISLNNILKKDKSFLKRIACCSVALMFTLQIGTEAYLRYKKVFWDKEGISAQTEYVSEGIQKGLFISKEKKKNCDDTLKAKKQITEKYGKDNSILFLSENTWYYLVCEDYRNSAYSAWLSVIDDKSLGRLKEYYKINPDKIPNLIVVDLQYLDYIEKFEKEYSFDKEELADGSVLLTNLKKI